MGTRPDAPVSSKPAHPDLVILSPAERRDTLLHVIRGARRRLILSLFRCDDDKVLEELGEALERNVKVEALLTQRAKGWEKRLKDLHESLEDVGAEVRRYEGNGSRAKYHAKYLVADDGPAVVGSLNFTSKCFRETCDFLLVTFDPAVIGGLQRLFEGDWKSSSGHLPRGLSERLIVGPNQARTRYRELLEAARHSIRIIDHRVVDPAMVSLLRAKREEGVTVEILGRGEIPGLRSHGKMLLVDGQTGVLGSISLSPPSLDDRREVAVVVTEPDAVNRMTEFFVASFQNRVPGEPAAVLDDEEDDDEGES
jgi:phosphatidylserine/phosphatidylglycerophosphate/cardiolipin synthase-like enzyme